jgi:hypothetical protein
MIGKKQTDGQSHLFLAGEDSDLTKSKTWIDLEEDPSEALKALAGDKVGPNISITVRAERLILAMNAIARRNMLTGFDVAVNDSRYKQPIWERYLDGTKRVAEHAETKVGRLHNEAVEHFWHATGFEALRGAGLGLSRGEVRSRADKMWRDFSYKVGSPVDHKELVKMRNAQKRVLPKDHKLRKPKLKKSRELSERVA